MHVVVSVLAHVPAGQASTHLLSGDDSEIKYSELREKKFPFLWDSSSRKKGGKKEIHDAILGNEASTLMLTSEIQH